MSEPTEALRKILRGFPEETIGDCAEYQATGDAGAFRRAVFGIIRHHLPEPPARPLADLPGSTTLVADLGLDSITMVEMVFIFEDLFLAKIPQEDLIKVVTIDDLMAMLQRHVRQNV